MAPVKKQLKIPPIHQLRPTWPVMLLHTAIFAIRHAFICALVAAFFTQPMYLRFILQNTYLQQLSLPALFVLVFAVLCHCVPWLFFNSFFLFFDSINPNFGIKALRENHLLAPLGRRMASFKLPRQPYQQPSVKLLLGTVGEAFFNQYIVIPVALYAVLVYTHSDKRNAPPPEALIAGFAPEEVADYVAGRHLLRLVTSIATLMPHFMLANAFNEFGFYTAHGALHSNPTLYRVFHKRHHSYTGSVGIAAEYASPLEEILANTIPTIGYFTYMFFAYTREEASQSYFITTARAWPLFMTWMWARLWETYEVHSGYCFADTWLGKMGLMHGKRTRFHDFHHTHNVSNYGGGLFMDALLNTMDPYLIHRYPAKHPNEVKPEEVPSTSLSDLQAATAAMRGLRIRPVSG